MNTLPLIGLTVGDPAGIGPEISIAAAADLEVQAVCRPLLIGSLASLRRTADVCGINAMFYDVDADQPVPGGVAVKDVPGVPVDLPFGVAAAEGGRAAYSYLEVGVRLAQSGEIASLVTAPINKYAFQLAGLDHAGHTELLAEMTGSPWSLTLFTVFDLKVLFLTRHLSLRNAIDAIDAELVVRTLERFASVQDGLGLPERPRIAVQALNPHAGDSGLFGDEDDRILAPAVALAREKGIDAYGPVPADAVFALARQGKYDVVLALYHDIGAGVCKVVDPHATVSVTLGLPFLRLSVDHGTAFDIAGKGVADWVNMSYTIRTAAQFAH